MKILIEKYLDYLQEKKVKKIKRKDFKRKEPLFGKFIMKSRIVTNPSTSRSIRG